MRRLLILGLDLDDEPIYRCFNYLIGFLKNEHELRDRKEKKHDWNLLMKLFVSTWIEILDPNNYFTKNIVDNWVNIITETFKNGYYDEKKYLKIYKEILNPEDKKCIWGLKNFYVVSLMAKKLNPEIEFYFLEYILNSNDGIYYIYDDNLNEFPIDFKSKKASRLIYAYEILSKYSGIKSRVKNFKNWIYSNLEENFWDLGKINRDLIHFPLSDSWRKNLNRKIDSTLRILNLMNKI